MNKTLSQFKPHERDQVLEMNATKRAQLLAVLANDPSAAEAAF